MSGPTNITDSGEAPGPGRVGKPVVFVPYYSTIEKECEEGLAAAGEGGDCAQSILVIVDPSPEECDAFACSVRALTPCFSSMQLVSTRVVRRGPG